MSTVQNFIDVPLAAQSFRSRARQSLQTSLTFIIDQGWVSLLFLLAYVGLLIWDYRSVRNLALPPPPEWTANWPAAFNAIKTQLARESLGTWRASLASLVMVLYWGNALLYIADRSAAFASESVVGLVRYILRGFVIMLLLAPVLGIGLVLLVIPGILVGGIMITAATIAMFREQSIFRAIGEGYRVVTQGLPDQPRVLGFSRSLVDIVLAYASILLASTLFTVVSVYLVAGIVTLKPGLGLPLGYTQGVLANLVSSFLNLSFSIFVLRLYSEYRTLARR